MREYMFQISEGHHTSAVQQYGGERIYCYIRKRYITALLLPRKL